MSTASARFIVPLILMQFPAWACAQEKENVLPDRATTLLRKADQQVENRDVLEAERTYLEAAKVLEQQMAVKNTDAVLLSWCRCRSELGEVQFNLLKVADAKATFGATMAYLERVISLRPKDSTFRFELAKMHRSLSKGYLYINRYVEGEAHQNQAVQSLKQLIEEHPDRADYRLELSKWHNSHSHLLEFLGRFQEAETSYKASLQLAEKLVAEAPRSPEYAHQLAVTHNAYAYLVRESGRYNDAIALIRASIRILAKLEADYPDRPEYWFPLPIFYRNLAQPLSYSSNEAEVSSARREAARLEAKLAQIPQAARTWLTDADKLRASVQSGDTQLPTKQAAKYAQGDPASPFVQWNAAAAKGFRGLELFGGGSKKGGLQELHECQSIMQKLIDRHPDIPSLRKSLSLWYFCSCVFQGDLDGDPNECHTMILQWLVVQEKFADEHSKIPEFRFHTASKLAELTLALGKTNEFKEALRYAKLGDEVFKKLATDFPSNPKYRRHHADGFANQATLLSVLKSDAEAEKLSREGIRQWQKMIADFPGVPDYRHTLAMNYQRFGQQLGARKKYQEAEDAYREMVRIDERLLEENRQDAQQHFDLARGYRSIGIMKECQDRPADAIENYSRAIALQEKALKLNLRQRDWLADLRATVTQRADIRLKQGKIIDYQTDLQLVAELGEALDPPFFRLHRINNRAKKGETTAALKEADDLFQNIDLTDTQWFDLALFYTDTAAAAMVAAQKEALAGRAVASLRNALKQGYSRAGLADDKRAFAKNKEVSHGPSTPVADVGFVPRRQHSRPTGGPQEGPRLGPAPFDQCCLWHLLQPGKGFHSVR
jgi:tetratricopeptide (TPR) repeat protein